MFWNILMVCLIVILLAAAFVFTVLPLIIPGIILTIIAAIIFVLWKGMAALGLINFLLILLMGVLYLLIDWLGGVLGVKKLGGSKYGAWGAIAGAILGIPFGGLIGVILGTIIGATLFESLFNREAFGKSLKIGLGAGLGFLLGAVGKMIIVSIATAAFIWGAIK